MAKGEKTFSTEGRSVKKFEFTPPTPGDYDFKLRTSKVAVARADGANKVPYINGVVLELLNSAKSEGGKNMQVYHSMFLRIDPDKDGVAAVDRGDGLVAFAKSLGVKMSNFPLITCKRGLQNGDVVDATIVSPQRVADWLKGLDGAVGRCRTKVRIGTGASEGKKFGAVDYFIESEESDEVEEDEDDETEESDDEADESDEDEESDDDEDEEEEAPKKSKVVPLGQKKLKKLKR